MPALTGIKADKSKRRKVTFPTEVRAIAGEVKTSNPLMMVAVLAFMPSMSPLNAHALVRTEMAPRGAPRRGAVKFAAQSLAHTLLAPRLL